MVAAKKSPRPRAGGRPSAAEAERLGATILDAATDAFFTLGYGATTIDAIAATCGIAKRTFYARFANKADLFGAVVYRLVDRMRPAHDEQLFQGPSLHAILKQLADVILNGALLPESLALQRLMLAESARFPELVTMLEKHGARAEAITRIADLLRRFVALEIAPARFAAEQLLQMLTTIPQRRAMGVGQPMTASELSLWSAQTLDLFLDGVGRNASK